MIVLVIGRPDLARQRRPEFVRGGDRVSLVDPRANGDAVDDRVDGRRGRDLHPAGVRRLERSLRAPGDPGPVRIQAVQDAVVPPPGRIEGGGAARPVVEPPVADQIVEQAGPSAPHRAGCSARRRASRRRTPPPAPRGWRRTRWGTDGRGSRHDDSASGAGLERARLAAVDGDAGAGDPAGARRARGR